MLSFRNFRRTQDFTEEIVELLRTQRRRTSLSQAARNSGVTSFGSLNACTGFTAPTTNAVAHNARTIMITRRIILVRCRLQLLGQQDIGHGERVIQQLGEIGLKIVLVQKNSYARL